MNNVELQGRIIRIYNWKNLSIVKLFIRNQGKPGSPTLRSFPGIIFTQSDKAVLFDFQEGDYVNIQGALKVRWVDEENAEQQKNRKHKYEQYIRGYSIEKVGSEMSEKFSTNLAYGGRHEYKNEILLKGTIRNMKQTNGITRILIQPDGEKFNLWITAFLKDYAAFQTQYPTGANVCLKCDVQTTRRELPDGKKRNFENIVMRYVCPASEEAGEQSNEQ